MHGGSACPASGERNGTARMRGVWTATHSHSFSAWGGTRGPRRQSDDAAGHCSRRRAVHSLSRLRDPYCCWKTHLDSSMTRLECAQLSGLAASGPQRAAGEAGGPALAGGGVRSAPCEAQLGGEGAAPPQVSPWRPRPPPAPAQPPPGLAREYGGPSRGCLSRRATRRSVRLAQSAATLSAPSNAARPHPMSSEAMRR